jgi:hypothetical protein
LVSAGISYFTITNQPMAHHENEMSRLESEAISGLAKKSKISSDNGHGQPAYEIETDP